MNPIPEIKNEMSRFLPVNPIIQSPYYSQSFNGYGYCFNNPLRHTDPSGFSVAVTIARENRASFLREVSGGASLTGAAEKYKTDYQSDIAKFLDFLVLWSLTFSPDDLVGGEGAVDLARKVVEAVKECPDCFTPLYEPKWPFEKKIETICTKMYGADHVEYSVAAKERLDKIEALGLNHLAVCIAKTQRSLSDDQNKRGRPEGFTVKIRDIELSSGAGFIVPIAGTIMRMPGLPAQPAAEKIDIDENWKIKGLF